MKKRKDKKGILLKSGEAQRKDGRYEYRYTDFTGKRVSVYANTIQELRSKEQEIEASAADGFNYAHGNITVTELLDRYLKLKKGVRDATYAGLVYRRDAIARSEFGQRNILGIKTSDAKLYLIELQGQGLAKGTVLEYRNLLEPAFRMAVEEDVLRKNPFVFKLGDILEDDAKPKVALTKEQTVAFIKFCREDKKLRLYVDEFIVLLGTGLRVSELCGLTKSDIDFQNSRITVNKQLRKVVVDRKLKYAIEKPKTESGTRIVPMTDEVRDALINILMNRKKPQVEMIIDGCGGFILLSTHGCPKCSNIIEYECKQAVKKFNEANPGMQLPKITPHTFRHTFCTNMANSGIDIKALQYLMGHANVGVTLNVYAHKSYEHAVKQFEIFKEKMTIGA